MLFPPNSRFGENLMTSLTRVKRAFARTILRTFGWTLVGGHIEIPRRSVIVAHPHTSGTDLLYTLLIAHAFTFRVKVVAKEELFTPIAGPILRRLGCVPVKRNSGTGSVTALAELFDDNKDFHLVIAATGTREKDAPWKTGFLYVARRAKVPVLLATVDRKRKVCGLLQTCWPSVDIDLDLRRIQAFYKRFYI